MAQFALELPTDGNRMRSPLVPELSLFSLFILLTEDTSSSIRRAALTNRSHNFMVKPRVQEFASKCLNRSGLLDPGRHAAAAPGSHRKDTVGAGRPTAQGVSMTLSRVGPKRRTDGSIIHLVWPRPQEISPGMPEFSIEHPGRGRQMADGRRRSHRKREVGKAPRGQPGQSHTKATPKPYTRH